MLPDARRLPQVIFAPEPSAHLERHANQLAEWRQARNRIASASRAGARNEKVRKPGYFVALYY